MTHCVSFKDVTDFKSAFRSIVFRRFLTNPHPSDCRPVSDSDLIIDSGRLNFRKINCCPLDSLTLIVKIKHVCKLYNIVVFRRSLLQVKLKKIKKD